MAMGLLATATVGSVVLTGLHRYDLAADWYRVVGQRELEALAELRAAAEPGDLAIASRGPNGNPIGWWVQGYAGIPTVTSIDPAFLAFPDERAQAAVADRLFSSPIEESDGALGGARFVIVDRRGSEVAWAAQDLSGRLERILDGTLLILMAREVS
jgi:hypothetical protein